MFVGVRELDPVVASARRPERGTGVYSLIAGLHMMQPGIPRPWPGWLGRLGLIEPWYTA